MGPSDWLGLILSKRVYNISGSMASRGGEEAVHFNGKKLPVKDSRSYLSLFIGVTHPMAFERINERWEVGVGVLTQ